MIEENISGEDEWAIFQTNFDRIHEKFFTNLKERYPDLTPGDLRLCALLRLNMPTKDMARMQIFPYVVSRRRAIDCVKN